MHLPPFSRIPRLSTRLHWHMSRVVVYGFHTLSTFWKGEVRELIALVLCMKRYVCNWHAGLDELIRALHQGRTRRDWIQKRDWHTDQVSRCGVRQCRHACNFEFRNELDNFIHSVMLPRLSIFCKHLLFPAPSKCLNFQEGGLNLRISAFWCRSVTLGPSPEARPDC